jgi:hypothetical protein
MEFLVPRHDCKRTPFGIIVGTFVLSAPLSVTGQTPPTTIEAVLRDWESRRAQVRSIRYELEGDHLFPKGYISTDPYGEPLASPQPTGDTWLPLRRSVTLDFAGGRFRMDVHEPGYCRSQGSFSYDRTTTFDGADYKVLNPEDPNPDTAANRGKRDLVIISGPGNAEARTFDFAYWPLFEGLGIPQAIEILGKRSSAKNLAPAQNPDALNVQGVGVLNGTRCNIIRTHARGTGTGMYHEYWVDPARGSIILKHLLVTGKSSLAEHKIDYSRTDGVWHPRQWTYTSRHPNGRLNYVERITVKQCQINPEVTSADFTVPENIGMVIGRVRVEATGEGAASPAIETRERKYYRILEGGAREEVDPQTGKRIGRGKLSLWLAIIGGAAVFSVGFVAMRRRSRHRLLVPSPR